MITAEGYSKDLSIIPDGIAITWSNGMIEDCYESLRSFVQHFYDSCADENGFWTHKLKNKPKWDVAYVYIIFNGRVRYRAQYAGWQRGGTTLYDDHGGKDVDYPFIIMTGPIVKAPPGLRKKGFQGFRYTTKLF